MKRVAFPSPAGAWRTGGGAPNVNQRIALWDHQIIWRRGSLEDRNRLELCIPFSASNDQVVVARAQEKILRDELVVVECATTPPGSNAVLEARGRRNIPCHDRVLWFGINVEVQGVRARVSRIYFEDHGVFPVVGNRKLVRDTTTASKARTGWLRNIAVGHGKGSQWASLWASLSLPGMRR